jgi:uncharacterized protein (DUF2164 family)
MPIELSKQEIEQIISSVRKYFKEELEQEISEMRAKFLLDYFLKEIAPFAYNKGVSDAEAFLRARVEDLSGTCFEEGLTYWQQKRKLKRRTFG